MALLIEPVTAVLPVERLAPSGLLGGVLVLVAVAIAGRRPRAVGRFVR